MSVPTAGASNLWHPVLEVIRQRRETGSPPGNRNDGHCVGLAVEGGAMRGVLSGAMLLALADLDCRSCFDLVVGASAGAINGAYFLADAACETLSVYFQELLSPDFVSIKRLFTRRPALSLDFLVDSVLGGSRPLDWSAVLESPVPLHIVAGSLDSLSPVILSGLKSRDELEAAIRATACIPLLAGETVPWDGDQLIDAGMLDGHPARHAASLGCSHVLVLSTRPARARTGNTRLFDRYIVHRLEKIHPGLGLAYVKRLRVYAEDRNALAEASARAEGHPLMFEIAPPASAPSPRRLERRLDILMNAAITGYEAAASAISGQAIRAVIRVAAHPSTPLVE